MSQVATLPRIPGKTAAEKIMSMLSKVGIRDIQMFYDPDIKPFGMWAVVQVVGMSSSIIMPKGYNQQKPYLLWWCKDNDGKYRDPNDQDLDNIITVVRRAPEIWAMGEGRADKFEEQDKEKDRKHRQKLKDKVHEIAPTMAQALRERKL